MLESLKFVQGAIAKKDFLPAMTHFVIENGFVRAFNGTLALCAPIPLDLDCKPKAEPFIKAISNCNEVVSLSMTAAGRLKISSGKFKAFIDCINEPTLHAEPEGERFDFDGESFFKVLKTIIPVVGDDALRPWCNGILFKDQSAFATNNVVLVEYWTGINFPVTINVPKSAIREILRIGTPPTHGQMTDNSITFHFKDSKWVRSQLLETKWPDFDKVLNVKSDNSPVPMNKEIYEAIEYLTPFADKLGRIYFKDGIASTTDTPDEGAYFEIDSLKHNGIYQIDMLNMIKDLVNFIDFSAYPKPCLFYGDNLRGAIVGMKM